MYSPGDPDSGFRCEGTENPPLSLSSTHAGQQKCLLATHSVEEEKKDGFTTLEEYSTVYPHTCLFPELYMGTVIAECAKQCFSLVSTRSTIETIKEIVNLLNKRSYCQIFTAAPS
jgi:hypothetical protein